MKTLKTVGVFAIGWVTGIACLISSLRKRGEHPYEGCTVYEDDEIKVVRFLPDKHEVCDTAVIVYKDH